MTTQSLTLPATRRRPFLLREYRLVALAVDLLCVNASVLFALWVWTVRAHTLGLENPVFDLDFVNTRFTWFVLFSALWVIAAWLNGFYELSTLSKPRRVAEHLLGVSILILAAYFVIYFTARPNSLPRLVIFYQGAAQFALIAGWHLLFARLIQVGSLTQRVLIVGANPSGELIARAIREHLDAHYEIVGIVDDTSAKTFADTPVLGSPRDLTALATQRQVSTIVLAMKNDLPPDLFQALLDCQELGFQIAPMPVLFEQITGRVPVEHIGDNWYVALPLEHAGGSGIYPLLKRALDLIVAVVGLVLFAILFPFIALAIKLDSRGPLFYKQTRVGQGGKIFTVWKLRSMVTDAEKGQAIWATKDDPRITRVGRLLRKTRLDEFPQFVNILRGEMSAVGPRPERPEFIAQLAGQIPFYRLRHAVKPGMAGWAMINYDYVDSPADAMIRVEYDLYYIKHQSIWLDILILFRTLGQMVKLKGR